MQSRKWHHWLLKAAAFNIERGGSLQSTMATCAMHLIAGVGHGLQHIATSPPADCPNFWIGAGQKLRKHLFEAGRV
jgi:hypothetical protein